MLDFMEGNLSEDLTIALMAFANDHPELEIDIFDNVADFSFVPENIELDDKSFLKVDENDLLFDKMIAAVEGDLSSSEVAALEQEVTAKNQTKNYAYFKATKLVADETLTYDNKKELKVNTGRVITMPFLYRSLGAAAAVSLLFLGGNMFSNRTSVEGQLNSGMTASINIQATSKANMVNQPTIHKDVNSLTIDSDENDIKNQSSFNEGGSSTFIALEPGIKKNKTELTDSIPAIKNLPVEGVPTDNLVHYQEAMDTLKEHIQSREDFNQNKMAITHKKDEPYSLVTNAMSNVFNTDVAYVTEETKAGNSTTSKSTYVQVGKFSFERKKSK